MTTTTSTTPNSKAGEPMQAKQTNQRMAREEHDARMFEAAIEQHQVEEWEKQEEEARLQRIARGEPEPVHEPNPDIPF